MKGLGYCSTILDYGLWILAQVKKRLALVDVDRKLAVGKLAQVFGPVPGLLTDEFKIARTA